MTVHHFTHPLHLYRALLRETTYLFDQNARDWSREHIRSSFRRHAPKIIYPSTSKLISYNPDALPNFSQRSLLRRGRKFLYLLSRANQGHQRHLRNVLKLTYGRKGRRKRVLTSPLLLPNDTEPKTNTVQRFSRQWNAPVKFLALLNSQGQISSHLDVRRKIKVTPQIEEKNKWGRPMPLSRVRNETKKWYAQMAGVLMPPLPEPEWRSIQAKALNKEKFIVPPRRTKATRAVSTAPGDEETQTAANTLMSGLTPPNSRRYRRSVGRPHRLTQRFLSRFYGRHILNHTPFAELHPKGRTLVCKWDNGKRSVLVTEKPRDDTQVKALFG